VENFSQLANEIFGHYVLPVVRFRLVEGDYVPLATTGTGFTFGDGTFITCWHCVTDDLPEDEIYGVPTSWNGATAVGAHRLTNVERDGNGTDLALARIDLFHGSGFHLAEKAAAFGEEIVTFSYPLSENTVSPDRGANLIRIQSRVFRGYVMSIVDDDIHSRRSSPLYELDMPAPLFSSGSPLFRTQPFEIVGAVLGERGSGFEGEDFGLRYSVAHHLDVLSNAFGEITDGLPLSGYLASRRST